MLLMGRRLISMIAPLTPFKLRRKFRDVDSSFDSIETLYGVGYKYIDA